MNLLKLAFESPIVNRLGWTLLHFVWEGAVIALLLIALLAILRRRGAPARYSACIGALLLLAILPVVTFVMVPAPAKKIVATGSHNTPPSPGIGLLNAQPIRNNNIHATVVPVSAPASANHGTAKPQPNSTTAAVPTPPAQTPTPNAFARILRQTIDFLPRALPWLVLAWCAGALILSIYNLGGWMAVRRLRLLATSPVTENLTQTAASLARRMGITRTVRLLKSTLIDSPMVIGALKPIILLPASLLTILSPAQLESLLAHELAHIRRHDYIINLLQGIIETLLFYHPAIWWVSRRIRIERELCCDDRVVAITQNRAAYVRALAAVAESAGKQKGREPLFSRAAKGTGAFAVAASGGVLLSRVRRLLGLPDADAARSPRWLAGAVALALCLLATGTIVTRAADPAKDKDFDAPKTWILELEVVDKDLGEPIPKLTLAVNVDNRRFSFITDDQGHAHIEYPENAKFLNITPKAAGYVHINLSWRSFNTKDPVPDSYKLILERGTTIGGIINDEAGNPIPNVKVQLSVPYRPGEDGARVQLDLYNQAITTDGQGRWRCDVVPKDMRQPFVRLAHPDFLSDEMFGETSMPPLPKLRDMTGVMVMKKGVQVAGKALDDQGKPIAGAKVYQGGDRFGSNYPETKTDANGEFHFAHCRPGAELVLTVTAKGRAPDQKTLQFDKPLNDIEFRLEPGHTIKGRVVDKDGKPIGGTMIATDTWRGHRALMARFDTNAQGEFIWKEAPADEILTDFLKQGYMDNRRVPIKASDEEIVITLRAPVRVTGTVVDADTGKPVDTFKVIQGIAWENQPEISWQRTDPEVHPKDGKFEFNLTNPYPGYAVRIESNDYQPAESRIFKDNEGDISLDFKLKKGRALAGTIRTPDGKPLAGADIVLCRGTNGPYITNGQITQREQHAVITSDKQGHYQLPPQTGNFSLVVVHDQGYAEVSPEQLAKSFDITLPPWGKVEGKLRIGNKPGARQTITVNHQDAPDHRSQDPRIYHDLRITTDETGHFIVDHVPAGLASVSMQVQFSQYTYGSTQSHTVEVKAGETTHIDVGGIGRPVMGKLSIPAELTGKMNPANDNTFIMTKIDQLPDFRPPNWADMDDTARKKFTDEYRKSAKYLDYVKQIQTRQNFSIKVNTDGTFRVEDIPAGVYQFTSVAMAPSNKGMYTGEALATANIDLTIPEMPGGRSDDPLDIGTIPYKAVKRLDVGDAAPALSSKTLDDKPLNLEDYKGKYVLLIFFGSNFGQPTPQSDLDGINAARARFGKDGKFEVIGVNFDEKIETTKKFAADHKLTWPICHAGEWNKSPIPEQWCLRTIPTLMILSPEGKILTKDIRVTNVTSAIETAMKPATKN